MLQLHLPIAGISVREVILEVQGVTRFQYKCLQEMLLFLHLFQRGKKKREKVEGDFPPAPVAFADEFS